jgi:starvation-inducible outer membrane lipoprotein
MWKLRGDSEQDAETLSNCGTVPQTIQKERSKIQQNNKILVSPAGFNKQ